MSLKPPEGQWLRTKDAVGELKLSKATLNRRKEEEHFKLGTHFIRVGPNSRSLVHWNVDECR